MNRKRLFNDNWEFVKTPYGTGIEELPKWEKGFRGVDIPHDWLVYDTRKLYETGTGWYRRQFEVSDPEGARRLLRFDGVYMDSRVYVNGQIVGEWKYGYSTFEFDITEYLHKGENEIMVRVDHHEPNSRWYSGAGIYRNVWLKTVPETYLASDGIYIATRRQDRFFVVEIEAELAGRIEDDKNESAAQMKGYAGCFAVARVLHEGKVVKEGRLERAEGSRVLKGALRVESPKLWDVESPNLYQLEVELDNGDRDTVNFGFREFSFDPEKGFVANGRRVKLHGVCEHHDLGCLGAAFHKAAMRRKLVTLKKMGVNAIRTSHNMPAPELMELADEMGFYIDSEAFDMWMEPKTEYDYARFFDEWAETDVASWIRRDRNHPSVIMWSIGNEIHDTHNPEGLALTKRLKKAVEEHDPRKNARVTIGSNYMPWQGAQNCADVVKLAGYNYAEIHYDSHHEAHPDWIIYGSETSSIVQSRGVYHFPLSQSILTDEDEQCSAFGNSRPSWAARSVEYCICVDRDRDYAAGQFLWTGHDYIGEPTPYKTKNSYFGQIDTAGFPKDTYYMYQAEWTDYKIAPMIHLMPCWDFNPGQMIDIRVCSNAPEVEVFVNERSLGRRKIDHAHGTELFPSFRVPYEPGCIRAVAYDETGKVIARDSHKSFGDSARVVLKADKEWMKADGRDLIFVEIGMEDAEGNPVENAMDYVEVCVSGAGRLVGLDNGDSTDYDQYKGTCRKLFNGRLLAVIAARTEPGPISVTVRDIGEKEDIEPAKLVLQAVAAQVPEGISATEENSDLPLVTGRPGLIPARKIELVSMDGRTFDENKTEIEVEAYLYPADATDREVIFSVVNDAGIPVNLAEVELLPAGESADSASCTAGEAAAGGAFCTAGEAASDGVSCTAGEAAAGGTSCVAGESAAGAETEDPAADVPAAGDAAVGDAVAGEAVTGACAAGRPAARCRVRARGDGSFRLRAAVKNGTDKVKLLSQLEFSAAGLGEAYMDPYGFIAGALYNYSSGDVGGFSEKSVASAQEGLSVIGYRGLDFGEYGSDEITLPIFTQNDDPHYLQIWEGIYGEEGSELLADVVYQKPSIWDVYQPETYRLDRRVRGITSLSFVIRDQRYFIKGFSFTKLEKAYEKLYAAEANSLYGDAFTVKEDAVEGIGNNVSLEFENMDFADKGFSQITICGRTGLPANSIHIRFFGEDGEAVNRLVEFPHSEEYTEVTFPLESITGKNKVVFVFLPGCDFDFKWFRFS